ncbi:hypothetical protein AB0M11_25535 [Streptomyces sp. NPDC051987]|uniref:hypothetical protein n=1 Tax=Streptomyces sp. NPDC051987 TaxID=3155808 RepID=UPI003432C4C2
MTACRKRGGQQCDGVVEDLSVPDSMRPPPPPAKGGDAKASPGKKKTSLKRKHLFGYDAHLIVAKSGLPHR